MAKGSIVSAAQRQRESWNVAQRGEASWFTFFSGDITDTDAMSAGLMEIEPHGGSLAPHRHTQPEIYYVVEGSGQLTIDGETTRVTAGCAAFIPGDAEHALRNDTPDPLRVFYVFPADRFADVVYRFS